MSGSSTLRYGAASPRVQRWLPAWLVALVIFVVAIPIVDGTWWGWGMSAVLSIQMVLAISRLARIEVDGSGIRLMAPLRSRRVAWAEIATLRLQWDPRPARSSLPRLELRNGTVLRSDVLQELAARDRTAERAELIARLEHEATIWGFDLEVRGPKPRST